MDGSSEGELKPKRARRTRTNTDTVSRTAVSGATRQRAIRQRARRAVNKTETPTPEPVSAPEPVIEKETVRKAPTPLSDIAKEKRSLRNRLVVIAVILVIGVSSSAAVGSTDKGLINVNSTIEARNQQARESGSSELVVPVQNTNQLPDGGLIGLDVGAQPPAQTDATSTEAATSTATSTEEEAESTGSIPATAAEAAAAGQSETATSTGN